MFIKIDKNTNKIVQTISENYGIEVSENELLQGVSEDFKTKYGTAQDYNLIIVDGIVTDITVIKTWEQWQSEQPIVVTPPTDTDRITALEEVMMAFV